MFKPIIGLCVIKFPAVLWSFLVCICTITMYDRQNRKEILEREYAFSSHVKKDRILRVEGQSGSIDIHVYREPRLHYQGTLSTCRSSGTGYKAYRT